MKYLGLVIKGEIRVCFQKQTSSPAPMGQGCDHIPEKSTTAFHKKNKSC